MNVLVTDGESRSALAVTRSFGRRGYSIFVSGVEAHNISGSSKYCKKNYQTPDPLKDGNKFAEKLCQIVKKEKIDIVFPITEQSIYRLNKVRSQLPPNVILSCAHAEIMEAVSNKYRLFELAQNTDIPIPETVFVAGREEFFEKGNRISSFPVVVKPAFSRIPDGDGFISAGVMYAASHHELMRLYESTPVLRYPSLIQEFITGPGTGLFTLFDVDHHLALFSHRRLLEKPPSGGVSVISESITLDPEMVKWAERLLSEVKWKGVAMVEFKRDIRDGRAKLMEINGRFWGSLQLAVSSGVDFPALSMNYYLGKKPDLHPSDYKIGHKLKWFFGIMDHLIIRLKKGELILNLSAETPSRLEVAKELFKPGDANTSFDVYDPEDLNPLVSEIKTYIKNLFRLKR